MMNRLRVVCMALLLLLLATMVFVGCDQTLAETGQGSLRFILRDAVNARTIAPALDMEWTPTKSAVKKRLCCSFGASSEWGLHVIRRHPLRELDSDRRAYNER